LARLARSSSLARPEIVPAAPANPPAGKERSDRPSLRSTFSDRWSPCRWGTFGARNGKSRRRLGKRAGQVGCILAVGAVLIMLRSEVRFPLAPRKSPGQGPFLPGDWSEARSNVECKRSPGLNFISAGRGRFRAVGVGAGVPPSTEFAVRMGHVWGTKLRLAGPGSSAWYGDRRWERRPG
jgi:hypothetical protein